MDDLNTLWSKLLSDYARIKNKATKLSGGYQAFIDAAAALIRQCYGALFSLTDNEYTVDGGTPFTQIDVITELVTESGPIVSFDTKLHSSRPIEALIVDIDPIQSGSGDPSLSNIRPISGWNGVKVTRTGKNLLKPPTVSTSEHNGISFAYTSDGGIVCNGTSTGVAYSAVQNGFRLPVGRYVKNTQGSNGIGVIVQTKTSPNWTTVQGGGVSDRTVTINAEDTLYDLAVRIRIPSGITLNNYVYYPMLRLSGDSDTYEPYNGNTYNISLASAGTVYGGTLDVTTGVLTVDRVSLVIDGSEQYWFGVNNCPTIYNVVYTDTTFKGVNSTTDIINNLGYVPTAYNYAQMETNRPSVCIRANENAQWRVYICTSETTLDGLKRSLEANPLQIVYPLATPYEIQLTPQEIKTLIGNNNIWADAGDVTVTYPAKSDKDCNGGYPGS